MPDPDSPTAAELREQILAVDPETLAELSLDLRDPESGPAEQGMPEGKGGSWRDQWRNE
jgi:hypothetical protein